MIMGWVIYGSFNAREKVNKAEEHLLWLKDNHWRLNCEEVYRIDAIRKAPVWMVKAFEYLDAKRMKYDEDYKQLLSVENKMSQTAKQIRELEAKAAQANLQSEENLLEENSRLNDENYWLRVELQGLKQTSSINQKSRRLR